MSLKYFLHQISEITISLDSFSLFMYDLINVTALAVLLLKQIDSMIFLPQR